MSNTCLLPASKIRFFLHNEKKVPRSVIYKDIAMMAGDMSFRDTLITRIASLIPKEKLSYLPFLVNKVWYGDKMVYDEETEQELEQLLAYLRTRNAALDRRRTVGQS